MQFSLKEKKLQNKQIRTGFFPSSFCKKTKQTCTDNPGWHLGVENKMLQKKMKFVGFLAFMTCNSIVTLQSSLTRGGGGGTRKFLLTNRGKKWKRGKMEKKRRKILKSKVENWKRKEAKVPKWGEDFFFSFFLLNFLFFYFIYLLIYLFFAFHFSKFFLSLPKWKFSTGEKAFHARKKIRKNDFAPSEKFSCYAPDTAKRISTAHID